MKRTMVLLAGMITMLAATSYAQVERTNWVPNVGELASGEATQRASGDAWTFLCSRGQTARIFVDTKDDNDDGTSNIDPVIQVFNNNGGLIVEGDDGRECSFEPVCGFSCPDVEFRCRSQAAMKTVEVRDFGVARTSNDRQQCSGGGGYVLTVQIVDANGNVLSEKSTDLGGGAAKKLPQFIADIGSRSSPLLDDEGLPGGHALSKK